MKNKKILCVLAIAVTTVSLIGCSDKKSATKNSDDQLVVAQSNDKSDEVIDISQNLDMIKKYDSINALKNDAEVIFKGTVLESKSYRSGEGILTEYKFKIEKDYKNTDAGKEITIVSAGGEVSYDEYMEGKDSKENLKDFEPNIPQEKLKKSKIRININGSKMMEKGKSYVIFANTQPVGNNKNMYCVLNVYEGEFGIDKDTITNKALKYSESISEFEKELIK